MAGSGARWWRCCGSLAWRAGSRPGWLAGWLTGLLTGLLTVTLLTSGCALLPKPAVSTDPAATASAGPAPGLGLRLVVNAPADVRPVLEKYLDLARLQTLSGDETIDDTEWARLVGVAPAQARELLQTEGYFEAQVSVRRSIDRTGPSPVQQVDLTVLAGPRTQVAGLQIETTGNLRQRIANAEPEALALQAALPGAALLQPGRPFRNSDWADSKQQMLARLRAAGYATASLTDSRADIDAAARRADLHVLIDSGPLFLAGPLQVEGLKVHDLVTVHNLAGFGPGTPLTEARVLDYQERLQKAGLFESVGVTFDPDPALAAATPVRVRLVELALQQAIVGLGVSANTGPRATLEHTHRRPLGWAVVAHNKIEWGRDNRSYAGDFQSHPGEGFYRNLLGVQLDRIKSNTDVVLSQRLRLGRTQDTPRIERLYFAELLRSEQTDIAPTRRAASLAPNTASALSVNYHWVWRDLDNVLLPTRGSTWTLQAGVGQARSDGGASGPFSRLYGRVTGYLPVGDPWYGQARLEAGHIVKAHAVTVPDALGFRAGGDDSVRGYAYRALAPIGADGNTVSGQSLLTGSVELARPILASLPSVWGAVFIDAGRAVNRWTDYRAALGYGVGVRWRSPIGPLKVDLAWGDETRRLRLHFSVGIAF